MSNGPAVIDSQFEAYVVDKTFFSLIFATPHHPQILSEFRIRDYRAR